MTTVNNKKIRGWKRRIKEIDRWFEANKMPDLSHFEARGEEFVKIRIDPWTRVCDRVPPDWYFRLVIQKLVLIYNLWEEIFERQEIPYDLQIWLNYPNTIRSEVVCASVDNIGGFRDNYYRKSTKNERLPLTWADSVPELQKFTWRQHDDEDFWFKEIHYLDQEEINELLEAGFVEEEILLEGRKEIRYSRKVGNVWIGRMNRW
ncbi:hypothetical protein SAMN05216327_103278 [Dyadobacter sp. SG02]|uniref:hypothetical protein n=1 Tax=Dyadobacter sp. SG02 TaxID=1855291 RepID=UPI0008B746C6|nr:hypothetical protein [Dyadobacter sp. SG02]SEI69239.1 hypothetical protein SAMN05216327_103278 [Dyadobacter sp. SG02]